MLDKENVIKGLEETKIMLTQAVDRGGEMSVMQAFKCLNCVTDTLELLNKLKPVTPTVFMAGGWWKCPTCGKYSIPVSAHYCFYCGQAVVLEEMQKDDGNGLLRDH